MSASIRPIDISVLPSHDETPDVSDTSSSSSRSSTPPPLENPALNLQADNALPNDALLKRTTRQGKEWRAPSTMHTRSFWQRNWPQRLMSSAMMNQSHHTLKDGTRGPVPSFPLWRDPVFLLPTTLLTPALQQLSMSYGYEWPIHFAFVIYFASLVLFFMLSAHRFNKLGQKYGVFNETNRARDHIPDDSVDIMAGGILMYFFWRIGLLVYHCYDPSVVPSSNFSWTYVIRFQIWFLVNDLMFYCYHRATHEVDFLWKIHSLHHRAKAPTMAHAALAGHMQHLIEIIIIPSLSTYVVPLSFHEQWMLYLWLAHIETMGHSGIRIHGPNPNTWLACLPFGAELVIEDHDLHHRYGKSGKNYGKQTRFWDVMFGTCMEREEGGDCKARWI
ncbi:hypothetical protein RQP46_003098 [Phenoliferia psychrophenolica]